MSNTRKVGNINLPLILTSLCMMPGAQAEPDNGANNRLALEEIIVTAQKRSRSLQDTPISIAAYNTSALETLGIETAADVGEYTPNVDITPSLASKFNIRMSIRGNGTAEPSLAVDPKVGIYLDGAYIARNSGAIFDLLDLERIEILRGPQGTLWGKNTTGGAVNLITQKPDTDFGFKQSLTAGSDGLIRSLTSIDTGEKSGFSAKLSYLMKKSDGWAKNISTAANSESDLGSEDTDAFRIAVHWTPTDNVSVDYSYDQTNGEATPVPLQVSEVLGAQFAPIGLTIDTRTFLGYAGNPFATLAAIAEPDKRLETFNLDAQSPENVDVSGHNLTISWQLDNIELKSITSFRDYESDFRFNDIDGSSIQAVVLDPLTGYQTPIQPFTLGSVPIFHTPNQKSQDQFSQEFQALGSLMDSRLHYVVGLYHFEEDGREINPWALAIYNPFASPNAALIVNIGNFYEIEAKSQAIFGQFSYDATDDLSLTLGMRYTRDEKTITLLSLDPDLTQDHRESEDWSEFTADFTVNYALNNDINLYAKVSQGYSSGIFNPGTLNRSAPTEAQKVLPALTPVDPEETTAYEIGLKSMWWDNRLLVNGSIFYNDSSNLQINDLVNGVRVSQNSGEAKTRGFELDLVMQISQAIMLNASYGYLDNDFDDPARTQIAARNSGTFGISYEFPKFGFGQLRARIDTTYLGATAFSYADTDTRSESRQLLNARLSLTDIKLGDGNLSLTLWGKNLTDKEYRVHGANFGFYRGYSWGEPRSAGVNLSYQF